jgi:hypothetical protein
MAVGVRSTLPGVTQKQYEQVTKKVFGQYPPDSSRAPDGLIVHSAGPSPDGWYIYDIWETPEDFKRFGQEKLEPAVQEVMGAGMFMNQSQFFEIESLIRSS